MSELLAIAMIFTLTLGGCSDGEGARSTTEGKAPYNAKDAASESPTSTDTAAGTETTTEGSTVTDTSSNTATEGVTCQDQELDARGETFTNNINFSPACKSFTFFSPGSVFAVERGDADGPAQVTVALEWRSGDATTVPVTGKVYTEAEKNPAGEVMARARLDVTGEGPGSYFAKTSAITFVKLPLTPGSEYEITFDFSVDDIPLYPGKTVTFSGTAKGSRP